MLHAFRLFLILLFWCTRMLLLLWFGQTEHPIRLFWSWFSEKTVYEFDSNDQEGAEGADTFADHCLAKREISPSSFRSVSFKSVVWTRCFTTLSRHREIYRNIIWKRNIDFLVNIFCPHNCFATAIVVVWSLIMTQKAGVASEPEVENQKSVTTVI